MPQMMPLSWLILFIMFSLTLIMFSTTNYYLHTQKAKTIQKGKLQVTNVNWKW
nr:ATP synthase F0 subunit 8 [Kalotermes hilli]